MKHDRPKQPPVVAGRVPPNDLTAEASVLDAIIENRDAAEELLATLKPTDFYSEANASIFEAALSLRAEGKPSDRVTILGWLRDRERLASVGGIAYLAETIGAAPAYSAAWAYAESVRDKAALRRMISEAHTIAAEGYGDVGSPAAWLAACAARVEGVVDRGGTVDKPSPIGTSIRAVFSRMTLLQDGVDAGWLTTGNTDVDALLGPVGPGDLIVVGARTHVGKSTYMRGVAAHMAGAHGSVLLWSGEQDRERCAGAMVSCEAGVSVHKREKSQRDWEALTAASVKLDKLRISIVDKPRITGPALRAAVRLAKRDAESAGTKLAAVFVDYVQIMGTADLPGLERGANRERQISELSKYLKAEIAQGEGVLVMIGAQLNKDMDKRGPDAKPRTADLRESAALEQDADKIILIHNPNALARAAAFRDSGEQQEAPETEVAELIVAKARDGGQLGTARTIFRPQSGRFDMFKA